MERARSEGFVAYLKELAERRDRGALATLRRSLAFPPGSDPRSFRYVEPWVVDAEGWDRQTFYLVAGLFAIHPVGGDTSLPEALADVCRRDEKKGVEARFLALLDSDLDQLPDRLRRIMALLPDGMGINWAGLTSDLLRWFNPQRTVQRAWARQFYRRTSQASDEQGA
ncbi:MAG: type I-E CRISPR-associated protein Cse2/CasB [Bacillota bacterium]